MQLTTGAILRRITETDLSVSAHKLATIILDGIAWKDGYNGLDRGTAAFTLAHLAEKMGVSRQYLSVLLAELAHSPLCLERQKPHGKYAPWLFRFGAVGGDGPQDLASSQGDTSLSIEEENKTIFSGRIDIGASANVYQTRWAALIKAAKACLPCWDVDTGVIWERFLAFNRAKGNRAVPAGFLLGFMRKWRTAQGSGQRVPPTSVQVVPINPQDQELLAQIRCAPVANRQFHEVDLCRVIGQAAYRARVLAVVARFRCAEFTAMLAVHGAAVRAGEIAR